MRISGLALGASCRSSLEYDHVSQGGSLSGTVEGVIDRVECERARNELVELETPGPVLVDEMGNVIGDGRRTHLRADNGLCVSSQVDGLHRDHHADCRKPDENDGSARPDHVDRLPDDRAEPDCYEGVVGPLAMGEAENGALFSLQSSYVTVGNYPGIEARISGSKGAIHVRLVDEFGVIQTIRTATPEAVEFVDREIPDRFMPPGHQPDDDWGRAFYGNLVHNFCEEIIDGGETNQGNFAQSARVQEIINAVTLSHRKHRWINLPLAEDCEDTGQQSPY